MALNEADAARSGHILLAAIARMPLSVDWARDKLASTILPLRKKRERRGGKGKIRLIMCMVCTCKEHNNQTGRRLMASKIY